MAIVDHSWTVQTIPLGPHQSLLKKFEASLEPLVAMFSAVGKHRIAVRKGKAEAQKEIKAGI